MGPCALRLVQRQVKHVWTKKAKHVWNSSPDSGGPMKLNIILRQERRGASHSESFYLSDPLYSLCLFVCLVAQTVKNLPAMQETWVWSLDREDSLQRGRATHSCSLAWRIPWTEAAAGLQSTGSQESDTTQWLTTQWVACLQPHTKLKAYPDPPESRAHDLSICKLPCVDRGMMISLRITNSLDWAANTILGGLRE